MTATRGGPFPESTAADTAVDVFATHPSLALTALVVLVVVAGWVLISFAQGAAEVWELAADAVAARWPALATPGARARRRDVERLALAALRADRRAALQLATLVTLLRLSARP